MLVQRVSVGQEIGKKVVRLSIAVLGLLIVRVVIASLPMLKDAPPIGDTGIHPLLLAKAIVDTVVFVALLRFGAVLSSTLRTGYPSFPDSGPTLNFSVITIVVALAYNSYSGLVRPLLGENEQLYGWLFLFLGLAPVVGIVVLVSRNLDTITELVFRTGRSSPATVRCAKCGQPAEAGVKFCPECGSTMGSPTEARAAATQKQCSSCGAENAVTAKFCKECGKPLAA